MGVTKRDVSGIFDAELKSKRPRKAAVLDKVFDLSPKGITFLTDTYMNEWIEVGVELSLPVAPERPAHRHRLSWRRGAVRKTRKGQRIQSGAAVPRPAQAHPGPALHRSQRRCSSGSFALTLICHGISPQSPEVRRQHVGVRHPCEARPSRHHPHLGRTFSRTSGIPDAEQV